MKIWSYLAKKKTRAGEISEMVIKKLWNKQNWKEEAAPIKEERQHPEVRRNQAGQM